MLVIASHRFLLDGGILRVHIPVRKEGGWKANGRWVTGELKGERWKNENITEKLREKHGAAMEGKCIRKKQALLSRLIPFILSSLSLMHPQKPARRERRELGIDVRC